MSKNETKKDYEKEITELKEKLEQKEEEKKDIKKLNEKAQEEKENLKEEVEELKKKNDDLLKKLNRIMADFDNYRKRTKKEKSNVIKMANKDLLLDILPVLDNLELAVKDSNVSDKEKAYEKIMEGVNLVIKQFKDVLKDYNVEQIEAVGGSFDPNFHDALTVIEQEDDQEEEELVVEEHQKGYTLGDKVIRPAKVIVSKKKENKDNNKNKEEDSNG